MAWGSATAGGFDATKFGDGQGGTNAILSGAKSTGGGMDPMTMMALASFASQAATPTPAMPGYATSGGTITPSFDSSGWNVNFGSGSIASDRRQTASPSWQTYALVALGLVVVWKVLK